MGVIAICAAQFASSLSPSILTWGIDYWSPAPLWSRLLLLGLIALSAAPGIRRRVAEAFEKLSGYRVAPWAAIGLAFIAFVVFRSRGLAYGDGYSIRSYIVDGALPSFSGNLALMSGDLAVHWVTYRAVILPLGGSAELAYSLVSALAGAAALFAIHTISRVLYPANRGARWAIVAAGFSSGMAALWFGHVEAYSLVGAALLWSIALLAVGRSGWAWVAGLVACALHLLAIAFLPALLWATWGRSLLAAMTRTRAMILFLAGFVVWGIAGLVFSVFKPGIFVPILASSETTYTAFSRAHLTDCLNLLLFAAPLGPVGIAAWLTSRQAARNRAAIHPMAAGALSVIDAKSKSASMTSPSKEERKSQISDEQSPADGDSGLTHLRAQGKSATVAVLAVAAACLWYFAFWVDPLLGGFRDWDLLGVFGIPMSILGLVLLLGRERSAARIRSAWVVAAVFAIAHTGAFVASVQRETSVIERVDRLVRQDAHYSRDFHLGERLVSWAYILTHVVDMKANAIDHLRNRSEWQPLDLNSWNNLAALYWHLEESDSAAVCLERSLALNPDDPIVLEEMALCYAKLENWPGVRTTVEKLGTLRELKVSELHFLGYSLIVAGEYARADSLLSISLERQPNQAEAHYDRGLVSELRGDTAGAIAQYELAMRSPAGTEDLYARCARLYQDRQQWSDAERVGLAWQAQFPRSAIAPFLVGICRIWDRRYADALVALEQSARLDSTSALTHYYLATTYRNLNQPRKALTEARRAVELQPNMASPYLEMVYLAADAGDRAAAVSATREYLRRSPGDSSMEYLRQFMEP